MEQLFPAVHTGPSGEMCLTNSPLHKGLALEERLYFACHSNMSHSTFVVTPKFELSLDVTAVGCLLQRRTPSGPVQAIPQVSCRAMPA